MSAPLAHAGFAATTPGDESAATLRAQAEALAGRYFDALSKFQTLDAEIARDRHQVEVMSKQAKRALDDARARAVVAYRTSGAALSALIDSADPLDSSRRAHLIDNVNAGDQATYARLHAATRDLHDRQQQLEDARQTQADVLAQLRDQGAAIDAKLAQAEQAAQAATAAATAASAHSTTATEPTPGATDPTTTTTTSGEVTPPPAPTPPYVGTPGTSPHHDDPFLTCVRLRESGGNYAAVNPAGPYLGAYQFLQATWDLSANHAGRNDLVGVPADTASPYDQDEIAWALYQWQGAAPWGGSCP